SRVGPDTGTTLAPVMAQVRSGSAAVRWAARPGASSSPDTAIPASLTDRDIRCSPMTWDVILTSAGIYAIPRRYVEDGTLGSATSLLRHGNSQGGCPCPIVILNPGRPGNSWSRSLLRNSLQSPNATP